jgi:hypothetical protein
VLSGQTLARRSALGFLGIPRSCNDELRQPLCTSIINWRSSLRAIGSDASGPTADAALTPLNETVSMPCR